MAKNLDQSIHIRTIPAQVDNVEKWYNDWLNEPTVYTQNELPGGQLELQLEA